MPFTACLRLKTWETIQSCHEHSLRRQIKIHQKHGPKEWERQFSSVSNLDKFFNADIKLDQDRESKDRFCEICNSVGHSTEECTALDGRRKAACLTSKYYCRCFDANNIPATSHKLSKSSTREAKNCLKPLNTIARRLDQDIAAICATTMIVLMEITKKNVQKSKKFWKNHRLLVIK